MKLSEIVEYCSDAADYHADSMLDEGEFHPDWHAVRDMKFAELVAEECASLLVPVAEMCSESRTLRFGADLIRKQFGIK